MPGKSRGEQFGDGLEVQYSPGDLRLLVQPPSGPWRTALRVMLILLPLPLIAIAPVQQIVQLYHHLVGNTPSAPAQPVPVMKWLAAFGFAMLLHTAGLSMGRRSRVRFRVIPPSRVDRWLSKRAGSASEDSLHIELKTGGGQQSYSSERSSYFNLRIQPEDLERLPHGEHAKIISGPGDLWLRFETTNYEPFAINVPVDAAHRDRLAAMISEVFGQECRVVAMVDANEEFEADATTH